MAGHVARAGLGRAKGEGGHETGHAAAERSTRVAAAEARSASAFWVFFLSDVIDSGQRRPTKHTWEGG